MKSSRLLADSGKITESPGYFGLRREFNTHSQVTGGDVAECQNLVGGTWAGEWCLVK
jgi:hypothetical protein